MGSLYSAKFICLLLVFGLAVSSLAGRYDVDWEPGVDPSLSLTDVTLYVGDVLVFTNDMHLSVIQVMSKEDYDDCNADNPNNKFIGGDDRVIFSIDQTGPFYLISDLDLCQQGLKLSKDVSDLSSSSTAVVGILASY